MIITTVSVILGNGISLFGPLDDSREFSPVKTEKLNESLIQTHYIRNRQGA